MIDEDFIKKIIKNNFAVFQAFDVVDGKMTPKEYFKKIKERKDEAD